MKKIKYKYHCFICLQEKKYDLKTIKLESKLIISTISILKNMINENKNITRNN